MGDTPYRRMNDVRPQWKQWSIWRERIQRHHDSQAIASQDTKVHCSGISRPDDIEPVITWMADASSPGWTRQRKAPFSSCRA